MKNFKTKVEAFWVANKGKTSQKPVTPRCPCADCGTTEANEWPQTFKTYYSQSASKATVDTPLLVDFSVGIYQGSPMNVNDFDAPYTWLYEFAGEEIMKITTAEHDGTLN